MGERLHQIWQRLVADVHRNPGLWIGVGLTAVILVIAYLAYRQNQLNSQTVVPANGYGIPDYGASSGGSAGGLSYPGYAPSQPASPSLPISPVSTPFSSPVTAYPAFPSFNLSAPAPASPFAGFTSAVASLISGNIQNPSATQDMQHRGSLASSYPVAQVIPYAVQNPTASQTAQHIGTTPTVQNPTAAQDIAHRGTAASLPTTPTSYVIPTTIRPATVTTRGRVA